MSEELRQFLVTELATDLARAIEGMTTEQPKLDISEGSPPAAEAATIWRQKFSASSGSAFLAAASTTWISLGSRTLRAAGIEDGDDETAKSTFTEILGQAFSMLARTLSGRTGTEWSSTDGGEEPDLANGIGWTLIRLTFLDGVSESLFVGFDDTFIADLAPPTAVATAPAPADAGVAATVRPVVERSRTLELLLDVELPISVSFGRAQLPLKDVIKLTSGSIVELNRTIAEPVEIIVNNCVIARGEVVVVEGNFGVRIQQVISREERLRTLF